MTSPTHCGSDRYQNNVCSITHYVWQQCNNLYCPKRH